MQSRDNENFDIEAQTATPCATTFSNWCNADFFKSIVNVKEIFCPLTIKKPLWWATTAALAGGVIALEATTGALSAAATYNNVGIMAAIYAIDPIVQGINIITAKYPALNNSAAPLPIEAPAELPPAQEEVIAKDELIYLDFPSSNDDVAVVIPAHLAADKIEATIRSCLKHVKPKQIFIIDNGNSETPLDNTREIVSSISNEINYIWGHIGNKTFAQYIGTIIADKYKYIYTSDDDMRMPENFSFGTELINDEVKAVCYPIVAVHPDPEKTGILTRWQSLEYKLSDCAKLSQNRFAGVLYPHGAASLWDSKVFLQVLKMHDAVFYAEDVKLGMILQKLGYRMAMAAGCCLDTEAPTSLFGPTPNFYQQRVRSWEMGRQAYFFKFASQLLTVPAPTKSPIDFTFFKLAEAYAVYTNIVDWFRLPLFLLMFRNPDYWIRMAIVVAASYVPLLSWNYIKLPINNRSDLKSSLMDILTYPIFKLIETGMSIGGIARMLSVYGPNYTHKPNVCEREKSILESHDKLLSDITKLENEVENLPLTYKKIMYGKFFQPARDAAEIERQFDEQMYDLFLEAVIDSFQTAPQPAEPAAVATTQEEIAQQFNNSAIHCDDIPSGLGMRMSPV